MEKRPKPEIELTQLDWVIEVLAWFTIIALWVLTLVNYKHLPDSVPTHFDASGHVDSYGSRWTILLLPIISSILFLGLSILNKFPHVFNYPTAITPQNAQQQYTIASRLIRYLRFALTLIFTLIAYKTLQTIDGKSNGLGVLFLPLTLALIFIPLVFFIVKMFKAKNGK